MDGTRFLYGAPGANLEIAGEVIQATPRGTTCPASTGYDAGLADEKFETVKKDIRPTTTDAKAGKRRRSRCPMSIPRGRSKPRSSCASPKPAAARSSARSRCRCVRTSLIGCARISRIARRRDGDIRRRLRSKPDGTSRRRESLRWTLSRVSNNYQWYNSDGRWSFERVKSTRRVSEGTVDVATEQRAKSRRRSAGAPIVSTSSRAMVH